MVRTLRLLVAVGVCGAAVAGAQETPHNPAATDARVVVPPAQCLHRS